MRQRRYPMRRRKFPSENPYPPPAEEHFSLLVLFSEIPPHNQVDVLKKLDFKSFVKFRQCSKETVEATNDFRHRLTLNVEEINMKRHLMFQIGVYTTEHRLACADEEPIRFRARNFVLFRNVSDGAYDYIEWNCQKMSITAERFVFDEGKDSEPSIIDNLLKLLKPTTLVVKDCTSNAFLLALQELKKIETLQFYNGTIDESTFVSLETPDIFSQYGTVSLSAINSFFKQWVDGRKQTKQLHIHPIDKNYSEMLNGLKYTLLHTGKPPEPSADWEECRRNRDGAYVKNAYSIEREDGKKLFIKVSTSKLGVVNLDVREYEDLLSEYRQRWIRTA